MLALTAEACASRVAMLAWRDSSVVLGGMKLVRKSAGMGTNMAGVIDVRTGISASTSAVAANANADADADADPDAPPSEGELRGVRFMLLFSFWSFEGGSGVLEEGRDRNLVSCYVLWVNT